MYSARTYEEQADLQGMITLFHDDDKVIPHVLFRAQDAGSDSKVSGQDAELRFQAACENQRGHGTAKFEAARPDQ